jgi:DNA-binding Lrp family transcriptional regulator
MSSNDIARATGMNPANVRNRITELLNDGQIRVCGKKRDRVTGRTVRQYEKVENPHTVRWAEAEA